MKALFPAGIGRQHTFLVSIVRSVLSTFNEDLNTLATDLQGAFETNE